MSPRRRRTSRRCTFTDNHDHNHGLAISHNYRVVGTLRGKARTDPCSGCCDVRFVPHVCCTFAPVDDTTNLSAVISCSFWSRHRTVFSPRMGTSFSYFLQSSRVSSEAGLPCKERRPRMCRIAPLTALAQRYSLDLLGYSSLVSPSARPSVHISLGTLSSRCLPTACTVLRRQ